MTAFSLSFDQRHRVAVLAAWKTRFSVDRCGRTTIDVRGRVRRPPRYGGGDGNHCMDCLDVSRPPTLQCSRSDRSFSTMLRGR